MQHRLRPSPAGPARPRRWLSNHQRHDLKVRVAAGLALSLVAGAAWGIGPGLGEALRHAREHKDEPWAPVWYYRIGQAYEATWREERAQEVYEEFTLYWCGQDSLETLDFSRVHADPGMWAYLPWVEDRFGDDATRPEPLTAQRHPLLGKVLVAYAHHAERERDYYRSEHVWGCLRELWEPGTYAHNEAQRAWTRTAVRSF